MNQSNENSQHWAKQSERGNAFFLNLTRLIVKYCPLWLIKIATFVVVCYFYLTAKKHEIILKLTNIASNKSFHIVICPHFLYFVSFSFW